MVSKTHLQIPFSSKRISSVVPGRDRGENEIHELKNMDLAMKLHYIKGVYFFNSHAAEGVSIKNLKDPMFPLLDLYFTTAGRIRRSSETGRLTIKCNDAGVRIVEAYCEKTMDEWLAELKKGGGTNNCFCDDGFCYNQALGPDLGFSPLVFLQFTWFKCGGLAVGLSWAHILGDPFSANMFINTWGRIMAGSVPPYPINHVSKSQNSELPNPMVLKTPFSMKELDKPVGDHWSLSTTNNLKMETHSFQIAAKDLDRLISSICGGNQTTKFTDFDILSAVIWKSLSGIRESLGYSPKMAVTICHNGNNNNTHEREKEMPNNGMVFSTVQAANLLTSIAEADVLELAILISENRVDENDRIEAMIGRENGKGDFVVYGANLTFVNLEGANIYDLEVKGYKPLFANYCIDGVGDEGVVLVLPGPKYGTEEGSCGRTVTVVLPENEVLHLRNEMRRDWGIGH